MTTHMPVSRVPMSRMPVLICGLLLVASCNSFATPAFSAEKIPALHINANKHTPLETGREVGQQSKALFPDIEHHYDTHLATILSQTEFNQIQQAMLPGLLTALDTKYQEELKGVASSWTLTHVNKLGDGLLSVDEYHVLNLLPDIGLAPEGTGFGVLGKESAKNTPVVGRNTDWISTPELRSLQAITVYQYNDKTVVNIGFAGIIPVLSGYNDQGLFLAHFKADPYSAYRNFQHSPLDVRSSVFDLRNALETSTSVRQAASYLTGRSYAYSNAILMADKNTVKVLEYSKTGIGKVRSWNSATRPDKPWHRKLQIAAIDCHVLATMKNNCNEAKDTYRWNRLRALAQFGPARPVDVKDLSNILFDTANHLFEIFNPQTMQSMIYLPESGSLYLYVTPPNGIHSNAPVHQLYREILPSKLPLHKQKNNRTVIWLSGLLFTMSILVAWLVLNTRFNQTIASRFKNRFAKPEKE